MIILLVNFATSENLVVKSTMFPHRNIHNYSWTSPDGNTHNQIDHILIDRRWESRIQIYKVAGELTVIPDTIWWFAKVKERLVVSKQAAQKLDGEIFNFRKLNELEVRKQYQIEITNRFAALENLSDGDDINRTWENIKENIKTEAKRLLFIPTHALRHFKTPTHINI